MTVQALIAHLEGRIAELTEVARKTGDINIVRELEEVLGMVRALMDHPDGSRPT